ncbi:MAG: alpha/beta hydrolase [Chloroflexi bacterium]|nr:alpha/beta hydrolase [Chloroflexota bacterium]
MNTQELAWQTTDGLDILARLWQPQPDQATTPQKGIVCLIHGLGEHSGRYAPIAQALTQAGYVLLAPDLRGHGRSEGARGDAPTYATLLDDITLLLAQAAGRFPTAPRFLYGHSMGGNLALNYALRYPHSIAGAVISAPWLALAFTPPRAKLLLARVLQKVVPHLTMPSGLNTRHLSRDPAVISAYVNDSLVHDRISVRMALALMESGQWILEHAHNCETPLLLMHGAQDCITSAEATARFASSVPSDCTFKCWEGLYHEIHNEPQADAIHSMITWLDAHSTGHNPVST